jgi:hypothetical protein
MKKVAITNRSRELKRLLKLAKRESVVMQTPEGDEYMLSVIEKFDREIAEQRGNEKLMTFLDARFRQARSRSGISLEHVRKELGLNSNASKITRRKAGPHSR